ncbi:MAG: hypothetical protein FJ128_04510 [Deltaproteobacteria bacterium]|nr:hypothetical protein [Deltaproteobacteria bacterium]
MGISKEELVEEIFQMVEKAHGKRKLKASDIWKDMIKKHPEVDKKIVQDAIKTLVDAGRCVYTYFGGSFVEIPHEEAAAKH